MKLITVVVIISVCYANEVKSKVYPGPSMTIRTKIPCYADAAEQEEDFLKMTSPPRYKPWIRPYVNSGPLFVNVSLEVSSVASVDELKSEYSIQLIANYEWFDERLVYQSKNNISCRFVIFEGTEYHLKKIWYPEIRVPNSREPGSMELRETPNTIVLRIRSNGYIFLKVR